MGEGAAHRETGAHKGRPYRGKGRGMGSRPRGNNGGECAGITVGGWRFRGVSKDGYPQGSSVPGEGEGNGFPPLREQRRGVGGNNGWREGVHDGQRDSSRSLVMTCGGGQFAQKDGYRYRRRLSLLRQRGLGVIWRCGRRFQPCRDRCERRCWGRGGQWGYHRWGLGGGCRCRESRRPGERRCR